MAAEADDLRYFYGGTIGRSQELAITDAASTEPTESLPLGRYLVHILDATGRIYVAQGAFGTVAVAAPAAAPAFPMDNDGIKAFEFVSKPGLNSIAARATAAVTATLVITKISRGKN